MALEPSPIGGNAKISNVTVGNTAVRIVAYNAKRDSIRIFNNGSNAIYIGPANTVTALTGFPIPAGTQFVDDGGQLDWYGITSTGSSDVRVLETERGGGIG